VRRRSEERRRWGWMDDMSMKSILFLLEGGDREKKRFIFLTESVSVVLFNF
jgi:hypothetical protein